jgi:3-phenylpropionate/trans-cinnamate dioxygenase ferredoxin reductase subunit
MSEEHLPLPARVVIVGAGQGGAQLCLSLRQGGYQGEIVLLGDEPDLPYQRPPLSKAYMKGELPKERLYLRPAAWYDEHGVTVRAGETVTFIDRDAKTVFIGAERLPYDILVLATGARPRPLPVPGADLEGVFDLRALADVDAIRPHMESGKRLAIIGAGYIGLEAAAVARQLGLDVTVIEREHRVLSRVAGEPLSAFYEKAHRKRGVTIRLETVVDAIERDGEGLNLKLPGGETIGADLVLAGIGILPNDELAAEAGIRCQDGIMTDEDGRTSDPAVFAIGDCARRPLLPYERDGRLESVHNAIEQAKLVAAAILGRPRPRVDCPWFWSDQYDLKLQIAGLSEGHDETVLRGDPDSERFSVFYLSGGRLIAVDAVNDPVAFLASKKPILMRARPDKARLADPNEDYKQMAAEWLSAKGA